MKQLVGQAVSSVGDGEDVTECVCSPKKADNKKQAGQESEHDGNNPTFQTQ